MRLLSNAQSTGFNKQVPFLAVEGVAPYTYSVLAGGAGGNINPSTGVYTAPNVSGKDTIRAVDDVGTQVDLEIFVLSPLGLFCDVIRRELKLDADQVYIYNQKFNVPKDQRLYIAVTQASLRPIGNVNRFNSSGESDQWASFQSSLEVNIMSKGYDALNRKEEVLLALKSNYARRQMAANSFFIAPLSSQFNNVSEVDGPAIPFRFNITVNIQYAYRKVQATEYYDSFQGFELETNY